ncbi:hypothetical protein BLOT_012245, partial [Blomia tropicalis]
FLVLRSTDQISINFLYICVEVVFYISMDRPREAVLVDPGEEREDWMTNEKKINGKQHIPKYTDGLSICGIMFNLAQL